MRRRIVWTVVVLVLLVIAGSLYLAVASAADLLAARRALQGSVEDLERDEIEEARSSVRSASDRLDGFVASTLGVVPLVGHNLRALEAVADGSYPVLDAALELRSTADEIEARNLVKNGRVRLDLIDRIGGPLNAEADALEDLRSTLEDARSGWLLPPVFDEIDDLITRADDLHGTASKAAAAARLAPDMLGEDEPRTYLVILINNAELRGAGGILSGAGTISMVDGAIELGDFAPYAKLGSAPYERVPAPPGFHRRYGFAQADTTLWVNTTYSPHVPDVALVAARLYEKVKNVSTDGAIVVDPRGVEALMPPGASIRSPSGEELDAAALPDYIYSTAYEKLGGPRVARRESLLDLGRGVFKLLAQRGPGGVEELDDIAGAVAGGHLRFVSLDDAEEQLLESVDAAGALPEVHDGVYVNVQNHGADKLDFWMRRSVKHRCKVERDEALCETTATIANRAPEGLTSYVSPRPNDVAKEFLELYVPGAATIGSVELDGRPAEFLRATEQGRIAVGTDVRVRSGDRTTLGVTYTLPIEGSYELTVTPQPLTHDADIRVELDVPEGWLVQGPEDTEEGDLVYDGALDVALTFRAEPADASGLGNAWDALSDFWEDDIL